MELLAIGGVMYATVMALSWYFILPIIALLFIASAFSNDERVGHETWLFLAILGGIGYSLWGQISIGEALLGIAYYLVIGTVWSIANYAINIKRNMAKAKAQGATSADYELSYFQRQISNSRITRWVLYFPFSMFEYAVGEFVLNTIQKIVRMFGGVRQRIANHYYTKFFGA